MKKRDSRFELLRIISMLMIVIYHLSYWGSPRIWLHKPGGAFPSAAILETLGKPGAMLFIMIGAYFLVDKTYRSSRWIALVLETGLYSWIIFIGRYLATGVNPDGRWRDVLLPFPFMIDGYWFILIYIVILMIFPLFNIIINNLSRQQLKMTIIAGVILWSLMYNYLRIFGHLDGSTRFAAGSALFGGNEQVFYFLVYLIVAYIKRYAKFHPRTFNSLKFSTWFTILYILGYESITVICAKHGVILDKIGLNDTCSITTLIFAVGVFLVFYNLTPFYSRIINVLAASALGVYLISDSNILRAVVWQIVNADQLIQRPISYFSYALFAGITIYLLATVAYYLIELVFGKMIRQIANYLGHKVDGEVQVRN